MNQPSSTEASPGNNGVWTRIRFRGIALGVLAVAGVYLCYRMAQPCIPSLVCAGALALVFTPFHQRIEARVRGANLAAALSLIVIGLLVVAPATWFAQRLAEQAASVPQSIQKQIAAGKWHIAGDEHPQAAHLLSLLEQQVNLRESASMASVWLRTILSRIVEESAIAAVQVCLTLYFLFYFLRDRSQVLHRIRSVLPLSEGETDTLFGRVNDTVQATVEGILAFSALQGVLGGLMYWWLGVPSPWFWAVVMAAFAFVPVVDTLIIWLPAAVFLALEGRWADALVAAALVSLLVRAVVNFLYPVLVKDRLRVPPVSIFIALLGGVLLFGWSGLVLGPVVLTATSTLLQICAKRIGEPEVRLRRPDPERQNGRIVARHTERSRGDARQRLAKGRSPLETDEA